MKFVYGPLHLTTGKLGECLVPGRVKFVRTCHKNVFTHYKVSLREKAGTSNSYARVC